MIHLQLSVTKRGTIHLCKIGILLLDRDFEHDIYELIKSILSGRRYPQPLRKRRSGIRYLLYCEKKYNDNFVIKYDTKDQKGVASAEVIRGQTGIPVRKLMRNSWMPMSFVKPTRTV